MTTEDQFLQRHKKRLLTDSEYAKTWNAFEKDFMKAVCEGIVKEAKGFSFEDYKRK